jgi:shikimate dehydrogenase
VAVEVGLAGVDRITIVNRDETRGRDLVDTLRTQARLNAEFVPWKGDFRLPADTDIVINGTSIGLYEPEARLPLDVTTLNPGMVVADVVFSPPQTRLLRDAAARGCRTIDGLGMLVNQGVIGVRYWTGIDPEPSVMRQALEVAMGLTPAS